MGKNQRMSPKYKRAIFFSLILVLGLPYFGVILYVSLKYPQNAWPDWTRLGLPLWFFSIILIPGIVSWILSRSEKPVDSEKSRAALKKTATYSMRLVILWSLLFLYGLLQVVRGKIPFKTALISGLGLSVFIVLFAMAAMQARQTLRSFMEADRQRDSSSVINR